MCPENLSWIKHLSVQVDSLEGYLQDAANSVLAQQFNEVSLGRCGEQGKVK